MDRSKKLYHANSQALTTRSRELRLETLVSCSMIKTFNSCLCVLLAKGKQKYCKYLVKKGCILQVLYILSREKYRYTVCLREIADVWPPKGSNLCSFLQKLQTQFHCPQFLCQTLPHVQFTHIQKCKQPNLQHMKLPTYIEQIKPT